MTWGSCLNQRTSCCPNKSTQHHSPTNCCLETEAQLPHPETSLALLEFQWLTTWGLCLWQGTSSTIKLSPAVFCTMLPALTADVEESRVATFLGRLDKYMRDFKKWKFSLFHKTMACHQFWHNFSHSVGATKMPKLNECLWQNKLTFLFESPAKLLISYSLEVFKTKHCSSKELAVKKHVQIRQGQPLSSRKMPRTQPPPIPNSLKCSQTCIIQIHSVQNTPLPRSLPFQPQLKLTLRS